MKTKNSGKTPKKSPMILLKSEELKRVIDVHGFQESDLPKFIPEDFDTSKYVAVKGESSKWNEMMEKLTDEEKSELKVENKRIVINIEKIEEWRDRKNKKDKGKNEAYSDKMQGFEGEICYSGYHNLEKRYRESRYPQIRKDVLERVAKYLECSPLELIHPSSTGKSSENICVDMKRLERYRRDDYDQFIKACDWSEYKKLLFDYVKNRNSIINADSAAGITYVLKHRLEDILVTDLEEQIALLCKEDLFLGNEELAELEGFIPTMILILWDKIREREYQRGTIYYRKEDDVFCFCLPLTESECNKFNESYPWEIEVGISGAKDDYVQWEMSVKEQIEEVLEEKKWYDIKEDAYLKRFNSEVDELIEKIWESELIEEVEEEETEETQEEQAYKIWCEFKELWRLIVKKMLNNPEYAIKLFHEFGLKSPFER